MGLRRSGRALTRSEGCCSCSSILRRGSISVAHPSIWVKAATASAARCRPCSGVGCSRTSVAVDNRPRDRRKMLWWDREGPHIWSRGLRGRPGLRAAWLAARREGPAAGFAWGASGAEVPSTAAAAGHGGTVHVPRGCGAQTATGRWPAATAGGTEDLECFQEQNPGLRSRRVPPWPCRSAALP
jgi:hypothetical protein